MTKTATLDRTSPKTNKSEKLPSIQTEGRHVGIELFRIISMFLVVMLHVLGRGGVCNGTELMSTNYKIAWFMETAAYCSVNCYALISGYANIKSNFKFRKYIYLWLEVVTLNALMALLYTVYYANYDVVTTNSVLVNIFRALTVSGPKGEITQEMWMNVFLPLTRREYWYVNAYTVLFFLIPILNKGILGLKKHQHQIIIVATLFITTMLRAFTTTDNFVLSGGYSCLWLIILYIVGSYFRLYGAPKFAKWYVTLPTFFLCTFIAVYQKLHVYQLRLDGVIDKDSAEFASAGYLISYISPFMVIMAISLLIFFMNLNIKNKVVSKIITNFGKASFGVFIIHVGSAIWLQFLENRYKAMGRFEPHEMFFGILLTVSALFLVWSLISLGRIYLFKLLRINKLIDFICDQAVEFVAVSSVKNEHHTHRKRRKKIR